METSVTFCSRHQAALLLWGSLDWVESHWSGFAWIPIGALFILAVVGDYVEWICAFLIHLKVIYQAYRIARDFRHLSVAQRESMLTRMPRSSVNLLCFGQKAMWPNKGAAGNSRCPFDFV